MQQPHSKFRTIETGEIRFDSGKLVMCTVKSPALHARGDISLYIPDEANHSQKPLPIVILLHGVYGSHWNWMLKGKAHEVLSNLIRSGEIPPMILATPSDGLWGDGSAYLRHDEMDTAKWIVDDVPALIAEVCKQNTTAPHFITGLSMGGFGALRLGASNPARFTAFSGHSSITAIEQMPLFVEEPLQSYTTTNSPETQSVLDTICAHQHHLRPFRFDCGSSDLLIEFNRTLRDGLLQKGIHFEYEEFEGGHEWVYWQNHIGKSFRFFSQFL